ncbi:MAG: arabinofuranosyltransferase [Planctomycetota bacterium]
MTLPQSLDSRLRLLGIGLALLPLVWMAWRFLFVCDDAYISFRYALNLTEGLGLAFNAGVDPPVEGYTEFAWVLLMALGILAGIQPAVLSLLVSGVAGIALVLICLRLIERVVDGRILPYLSAALFLGCLPSLAVWASGGLATMPFSLALLLCFHALHARTGTARTVIATVSAIALVLLRADGALWVAGCTGPAILVGLLSKRSELMRAALMAATGGALTFGAHVAWRFSYYGDWLPNTARVKLGFSPRAFDRGWDYIAHYGLTFPGVTLALVLALVLVRPWRRPMVGYAYLLVFATSGYAVLVGGDFMAFGRFLVPALPFVVLLWAAAATELSRIPVAGLALAPIVSLMLAIANVLPVQDIHAVPEAWRSAHEFRHNKKPFQTEASSFRSELEQWRRMDWQAREWADQGKALAKYVQPQDTLVLGAVGAVGYYSGLFIYDLNGLVTREVALRDPLGVRRSPGHDKTVLPAFFLKDSPTWMYVFFLPGGRQMPDAYMTDKFLRIPLEEDYDRVKAGDLLVLQKGPGFKP